MNNNGAENDRLKNLRARQLADRDPTIRKNEFRLKSISKERQAYRRLSLPDIWKEIPHVWRGIILSFVTSSIITIVITSIYPFNWIWWIVLGIFFVLIILGALIGNALDLREDIKDNLR